MDLLRSHTLSLYDSQIEWLKEEARRLNKKSASLLVREWIEQKRTVKKKKEKA